MAIAEVIKFEGPQDALVWKFPIEDFNATSQLIVDETHEALLVVNGNAADLFTAGRRTLSVPNIPIARTLIEIPTGGNSPFPCKVFFINKVHAMDLLWGTQGPIALEDPLYDIFMHVMANGSMSVSVENSRKFMLKIVGFRDRFTPDDLIAKFRGIISSHVKDCISKIMINGMLSYFMMNAHLFELSGVIKERLDKVFEEYGVRIEFFNIETIEVPEADYKKVSEAKERRTSRLIVVTLFWNLWGSRLLWTLFPSMYNYDFLPQTLWHYMPSIITAILSGWEMATFIVAIKTRSKNFCILWMLPNMIIALVYLVKMFRLLTTYGGLAWIFDLAYVIACFVPFLSWWIIRKLEKAFAAFSRNDIKAYVLCGICAFLVLRIVGSITSFIERQLIAYDGYTSIGESLLLLILNIISMTVVIRVIYRHNAYAKDHCTSVLNNNKEGE